MKAHSHTHSKLSCCLWGGSITRQCSTVHGRMQDPFLSQWLEVGFKKVTLCACWVPLVWHQLTAKTNKQTTNKDQNNRKQGDITHIAQHSGDAFRKYKYPSQVSGICSTCLASQGQVVCRTLSSTWIRHWCRMTICYLFEPRGIWFFYYIKQIKKHKKKENRNHRCSFLEQSDLLPFLLAFELPYPNRGSQQRGGFAKWSGCLTLRFVQRCDCMLLEVPAEFEWQKIVGVCVRIVFVFKQFLRYLEKERHTLQQTPRFTTVTIIFVHALTHFGLLGRPAQGFWCQYMLPVWSSCAEVLACKSRWSFLSLGSC